MNQPTATVTRNDERHRYELFHADELVGFSAYEERGERIVFIHTEIDEAYGGEGLGSLLARYAVEDVIARHKEIVAQCRFIAAFLDKHPEYDAHVVKRRY